MGRSNYLQERRKIREEIAFCFRGMGWVEGRSRLLFWTTPRICEAGN